MPARDGMVACWAGASWKVGSWEVGKRRDGSRGLLPARDGLVACWAGDWLGFEEGVIANAAKCVDGEWGESVGWGSLAGSAWGGFD